MRTKIWGMIFLCAFLIGLHFITLQSLTYEKTVQPVFDALASGDVESFYEQLAVDVQNVEEAKAYFNYAKEQSMEGVDVRLKQAADEATIRYSPVPVNHEEGEPFLTVREEKKLGLSTYAYLVVDLPEKERSVIENKKSLHLTDETNRQTESIEYIQSRLLHEEPLERGRTLYVVRMNDYEGDTYSGQIGLYLREKGEEEAVYQPSFLLSDRNFQLTSDATFDLLQVGKARVLTLTNERSTELLALYEGGTLKDVSIDGDTVYQAVKVIDDTYLQAYQLFPEEKRYVFYTWKWDHVYNRLDSYGERELIAHSPTDPLQAARVERALHLWQTVPSYYVAFPQYAFTSKSVTSFEKGYIVHKTMKLGTSIDRIVEEKGEPTTEAKKGRQTTYAFSDGSMFVYDEEVKEVVSISLRATAIQNTFSELTYSFGSPDRVEETTDGKTYRYNVGSYVLDVQSDLSEELVQMTLRPSEQE